MSTLDTFQTYSDQITELLDGCYKRNPFMRLNQLKVTRNQVIKDINSVIAQFFELEETFFSLAGSLKKEATELNLSIEILSEIAINQQQIDTLATLATIDTNLSAIYEAYYQELVDIDLEITSLETQSQSMTVTA